MSDTVKPDAVPAQDDLERGSIEDERRTSMSEIKEGFDAKKLAAVAAVIVGGLFLLIAVGSTLGGAPEIEEETPVETGGSASLDPERYIADELGVTTPAIDPATVPDAGFQNQPVAGQGQRPQKSERQVILENARRSSIMAYSAQQPSDSGAGFDPRSSAAGGQSQAGSAAGETTLDRLRQSSNLGTSRARNLGNRDYLITAGTFIPCTLQTAIVSSQPGYATCIIPNDVYSDNGRVILMEKGTKVFGEYQAGIQRGQFRLFVLWTRATTPRGIAISLGSPSTDALGRSGVPGTVENFFWQRFGAALLFSLVDNAAIAAQNQIGNQGNNITQVPSQVPETIVRETIDIPPVLIKNQGESVGILVAQDFDFSDIYNLRLRGG